VLLVGSLAGPATGVPRRILEARFHQGRPVIRLEGIESMDEAERLAGAALRMPAAALGPLPEGTYYRHDLVGCEVHDVRGTLIGRVTRVEGTLERSYLVVPRQGGEAMIPLVDDICVSVDIAGRGSSWTRPKDCSTCEVRHRHHLPGDGGGAAGGRDRRARGRTRTAGRRRPRPARAHDRPAPGGGRHAVRRRAGDGAEAEPLFRAVDHIRETRGAPCGDADVAGRERFTHRGRSGCGVWTTW
jgi:16S rRNA processing protein RimM